MPVLVLLAGAAKRHAVQDRDIVFDDRGLAADKAGGMVEENAPADSGRWVDVGLKHRRRAALEIVGKILPPAPEQPMRQTVSLERMEAFEVEQWIDETRSGGIAVVDGDHVRAECIAEVGIG